MKAIHVWARFSQMTQCGLWYRSIDQYNKPNVVDIKTALVLNAVFGKLCKKCIKNIKKS